MNSADYQFMCQFLLRASGLTLGTDKEYLLNSRLVPVAQSWGLDDIGELVAALRQGRDSRLQAAVTEAMTTNETSFFRDKQPFDELKSSLIPELADSRRGSKSLRIWCAACSTGQEPYSILMLLREDFPQLQSWKIEVVATDIATKVLDRAARGIYTQFEVQRGLPVRMLMKYFRQVPEGWQVSEELRRGVVWKNLNLLEQFGQMSDFDIVFCRNVLIYFDLPTKRGILERIRCAMRSDGYLFLGAAETTLGLCDCFERVANCRSAVYRPVRAVAPIELPAGGAGAIPQG